jgi:hypothetical protein
MYWLLRLSVVIISLSLSCLFIQRLFFVFLQAMAQVVGGATNFLELLLHFLFLYFIYKYNFFNIQKKDCNACELFFFLAERRVGYSGGHCALLQH